MPPGVFPMPTPEATRLLKVLLALAVDLVVPAPEATRLLKVLLALAVDLVVGVRSSVFTVNLATLAFFLD